jgi:hypothetical protein
MRNLVLILFLLFTISCTRGFYNTTETYEDPQEARDLIKGLRDGTLIVQIPFEKKKVEILKSLYLKEGDPAVRKRLKEDHDIFLEELVDNQKSIVEGIVSIYSFSRYAFVPDTLIKEFKDGKRDNIFLNNDLTLGKVVDIDTTKTILFLRDHRDYDNLFIHKFNGTYPPNPFPYTTQLPLKPNAKVNYMELFNLKTYNSLHHAIYIMDRKLRGFYNSNYSAD